jgi:hypothetical protein
MTTARTVPDREQAFASERERLEYNWELFVSEFPAEQDCVEELHRLIYGHELECPRCHCKRIKKFRDGRVILCSKCKKETYTLAGTFFHNIRGARRWLAAIWFMEHGVKINASSFSRIAGIVRASADAIFKKLSFLIIGSMSCLPEISSREFTSTFKRRSRITPAGEHPEAEQTEIEKGADAFESVSAQLSFPDLVSAPEDMHCDGDQDQETASEEAERNNDVNLVYSLISKEPVHFDALYQVSKLEVTRLGATLLLLEMDGLVKRLFGDWYVRLEPQAPVRQTCRSEGGNQELIDSFINYVQSTFKGISRKYLQNYLGWFWCIIDRDHWQPGTLLYKLPLNKKMPLKKALKYVSPLMVKFAPLPVD